jgi:hypothetical protein
MVRVAVGALLIDEAARIGMSFQCRKRRLAGSLCSPEVEAKLWRPSLRHLTCLPKSVRKQPFVADRVSPASEHAPALMTIDTGRRRSWVAIVCCFRLYAAR